MALATLHEYRPDYEDDRRVIDVIAGPAPLRNIRANLMRLAYLLARRPKTAAYLVFAEGRITHGRLQKEWELASSVMRPEIMNRVTLCIIDDDTMIGIPRDPDEETQRIVEAVLTAERPRGSVRLPRSDSHFVVVKVLLNRWLSNKGAVTTASLMESTGLAYPTVAGVLKGLGSLVERQSDRSVALGWFPRDEFLRMVANGAKARSTVRFIDRSGKARPFEATLRRLEALAPPNLAIGGVLGAKQLLPDLDLAGTPRLDVSVHSPGTELDLGFVARLDPALQRVADPLAPATLAVHAVRHASSFFRPRAGGLAWADPIECILDLHEAHLELQANQLLEFLQRRRRGQ